MSPAPGPKTTNPALRSAWRAGRTAGLAGKDSRFCPYPAGGKGWAPAYRLNWLRGNKDGLAAKAAKDTR